MEWNEELKGICQKYQVRCMDVDYCTMKEPCQNVVTIYTRRKAGLKTALD